MPITINWVNQYKKSESSCFKIPLSAGVLVVYQSANFVTKTKWSLQSSEPLVLLEGQLCLNIQQYLNNPACSLNIDLLKQGTDFRNKVWAEICNIPLGQVLSYSDLAKLVSSGARAVANACRENPFPGIIPCHRVVAMASLGGYMGETSGKCLEIKKKLLAMEAQIAG